MFLAGTGSFIYMEESRKLEQRIKLERYKRFLVPNTDINKYMDLCLGESIREVVFRAVRRFLGVRGGDSEDDVGNIELFELDGDERFME